MTSPRHALTVLGVPGIDRYTDPQVDEMCRAAEAAVRAGLAARHVPVSTGTVAR